jgi:Arc/MetJ family transcription regulator
MPAEPRHTIELDPDVLAEVARIAHEAGDEARIELASERVVRVARPAAAPSPP